LGGTTWNIGHRQWVNGIVGKKGVGGIQPWGKNVKKKRPGEERWDRNSRPKNGAINKNPKKKRTGGQNPERGGWEKRLGGGRKAVRSN